jgi:hypothetical protein
MGCREDVGRMQGGCWEDAGRTRGGRGEDEEKLLIIVEPNKNF